jgi:hypothetical protein
MKDDFDHSAARPSQTIDIPRRWPETSAQTGRPTGKAMGPDGRIEHIDPAAVDCIAFATRDDTVAGYRAIYMIAEGVKPFITFLAPEEEQRLRAALTHRAMTEIDTANGPVTTTELNCFEHPDKVLIDPSRIARIMDGPRQHGDFLLFDVFFGQNRSLPFNARDTDFDSEDVIENSDIFAPYKETPQQKWYREADEGTLIAKAMDERKQRHRAALNDFAIDLAAQAPQLYRIENTKYLYFARPQDIEEVFIFTEQTDSANVTYKESATGQMYGMPVMDNVHFVSPDGAIDGIRKLEARRAAIVAPAAPKPPKP